MRYATLSLAAGLCAIGLACRSKDLTSLEPTIEEQRQLTNAIRFSEQSRADQLIKGFYELQNSSWRWTAPQFEVLLGAPPAVQKQGARLVLEFSLPDPSIDTLKNITLAAKINNVPLPPETYSTSGPHEYRRDAPASAFATSEAIVEFSVDKFLTPPGDGRNLALVVSAIALEPK